MKEREQATFFTPNSVVISEGEGGYQSPKVPSFIFKIAVLPSIFLLSSARLRTDHAEIWHETVLLM